MQVLSLSKATPQKQFCAICWISLELVLCVNSAFKGYCKACESAGFCGLQTKTVIKILNSYEQAAYDNFGVKKTVSKVTFICKSLQPECAIVTRVKVIELACFLLSPYLPFPK